MTDQDEDLNLFSPTKYEKKEQELPPSFFDDISKLYEDLPDLPFLSEGNKEKS